MTEQEIIDDILKLAAKGVVKSCLLDRANYWKIKRSDVSKYIKAAKKAGMYSVPMIVGDTYYQFNEPSGANNEQ